MVRFEMTQLFPESIDPRKVDTNFLKACFEQFMFLKARGYLFKETVQAGS